MGKTVKNERLETVLTRRCVEAWNRTIDTYETAGLLDYETRGRDGEPMAASGACRVVRVSKELERLCVELLRNVCVGGPSELEPIAEHEIKSHGRFETWWGAPTLYRFLRYDPDRQQTIRLEALKTQGALPPGPFEVRS